MHHLFKNKLFEPNSGPLTSEPDMGWLSIQSKDLFNFLFFKFKTFCLVEPTSVIMLSFPKNLFKLGIILREMKSYGIKNCLRLTIGNNKENLFLIKKMKSIFKHV